MATREEDELEDEFDEYDDYEDEDEDDEDEGGLSGLVVLLMGVVMLGAFASVVWIAYQQGVKSSEQETPFVSADPEPVKIETAASDAPSGNERAVYDDIEGLDEAPVEVVAEAPEEPVARDVDDAIGAIASQIEEAADDAADDAAGAAGAVADEAAAAGSEIVDDAVGDRIAALEAADQALNEAGEDADAADAAQAAGEELTIPDPDDVAATAAGAGDARPADVPQPASAPEPVFANENNDALSGSHVVQVGAFRSAGEADAFWTGMEDKLGDYLQYKSKHVEKADLGDRGIFYRLRVGPFMSADAARTYCAGLKERGQDCLTKAK